MGRENRSRDAFDLDQLPGRSEIDRALARAIKLSIRTHIPSTITSYNPATQTAVVTVDALVVVKVTDPLRIPKNILTLKGVPPNAEAVLAPITLVDIPVALYSSTLGYVSLPLQAGCTGMLHVSDRSLEAWLQSGIPTDPVFAFTHAIKDSVFYPGLRPTTKPITPPIDTTAVVIDHASLIKVGRLAVSAITKAEELITVIDAAWAAATPTANDGGANLKSTWLVAWNAAKNTIKATKGRVE